MKSTDFVKYLLYTAKNQNIPMNVTKLMKCMYICDGLLLSAGINFISENARTWEYGPVYPKAYKLLTKNGLNNLEEVSDDIKNEIENPGYDKIIKKVIERFGVKSAVALSEWSHEAGGPWDITMKMNSNKLNCVISKSLMETYFKGLISNGTK